MVQLRYPWLWMLLGWALVAGVVFGSIAPGGVLAAMPFDAVLMHGISYGLLMIWFAGLYRRSRHVWIAGFVFGLGILMEAVQRGLSYRSFETEDMVANAIGIGIGFILSVSLLAGWCQRIESLFGLDHVGH